MSRTRGGIKKRTVAGASILMMGLASMFVGFISAAGSASADQPADPGKPEFVTFCHVAGLAEDPANTITHTLPYVAVYGEAGHFNENGTTRAGHEEDYLGPCEGDPTDPSTPTSAPTTPTTPIETAPTEQSSTPIETAPTEASDPGDPSNAGQPEGDEPEVLGIAKKAPAAAAPTAVAAGLGGEESSSSSTLWILAGGALALAGLALGFAPVTARGKRAL